MSLREDDRAEIAELVKRMGDILLEGLQMLGNEFVFPLVTLLEEKGVITDEEMERTKKKVKADVESRIKDLLFAKMEDLGKGRA